MTRAMKDSGIEWIGQIPESWEVSKYKYFALSGMGETILSENLTENGIPVYSATQSDKLFGYVTKSNVSLTCGDFVIPARGNSIGCVTLVKNNNATCTQTTIYSKIKNIHKNFLFYSCLGLKDIWFEFDDTAIPQITVKQVQNNILPLPPKSEQQQIAGYLDEKCGKIDETIENQKKVVEKLKEYKQSLITETVCKGLNPTAPMKDSGIEWIGQIPEHWEVKKLKYLCGLLRGKFNHRPRNDPDYYDGIYPFLQTGDVSQSQRYITQYSQTLNDLGYSVSKEFPKNSIIMTIAANVGDVAILTFNACIPDSLIGFYPLNNVNLNYLYFSFVAMKNNLLRKAIISTQLNLNIEIVKEEKLLFPLTSEQQQIADYLDSKCAEIDDLISKKEQIIEKLTEYKKSLIFECITGKKEIV